MTAPQRQRPLPEGQGPSSNRSHEKRIFSGSADKGTEANSEETSGALIELLFYLPDWRDKGDGNYIAPCPSCGGDGKFTCRVGDKQPVVINCYSTGCDLRQDGMHPLAVLADLLGMRQDILDDPHWEPSQEAGGAFGSSTRSRKSRPAEPLPSEATITGWHEGLKSNSERLNWFRTERGLTDETIAKYRIGWDPGTNRYTIPVYDDGGDLVNVSKYNRELEHKLMVMGRRSRWLYSLPETAFYEDDDWLFICESELDCLTLRQHGFQAIATPGASLGKKYLDWFRGKRVALVWDVGADQAAQDAAQRLREVKAAVRVADLRSAGLTGKEDVTDWFVKYKKSADELLALVEGAPEPALKTGPDIVRLPADFWESRKELRAIRQAARSRMVAPDSLLAATLARLCSYVPASVTLPPTIGGKGSLNMLHAIVAPSGVGKGASVAVGEELVPEILFDHTYRMKQVTVGSAEGMIEQFFTTVKDPDDARKRKLVRAADGVLVRVDEGQMLAKLDQRSGQTTLEMLRQAYSGETLGNSYANGRPELPAHKYRLVVLLSVQPEHARPLLRDFAGGTPQRLIWWVARDPEAPSPDDLPPWAGYLNVTLPEDMTLTLAGSIEHETRAARYGALTGMETPGRYDGHRNLNRLKVAAMFALLDSRCDVNEEDWQLAKVVMDTSDAIRDDLLSQYQSQAEAERRTKNIHAAERAGEEEKARLTVNSSVLSLAERIYRTIEKEERDLTKGMINTATTSSLRHNLDAALEYAISRRWVDETDEGRYRLGSVNPS